MSVTPWLPTVRRITDGDPIDQATINAPIDQLIQRDQHLYEKFQELVGKSVLTAFAQPIHPQETFTPGELSIAYFRSDSAGAGLGKGTTGFTTTSSSSMFTPKASNYSFGLVKAIYTTSNTADLYTEGLCELDTDIDDAITGLIHKDSNGNVEEFAVGPYYLSSRAPGKITRDPAGIPVYIGFAISKREFLLHTNVDEFSQFFINYRFHILDRVAGIPHYDAGSDTWTITSTDTTKLGWVPAGAGAPTGAVFYYNIPSVPALAADTGLEDYERAEAAELYKNLPPVPANFNQVYVNGVLARYKDEYDSVGIYSVNEYGIWWHSNKNGTQPWSNNYSNDSYGSPDLWNSNIKLDLGDSRKNIFMSFSRFNPALRTQLVSSITAKNAGTGNFIKFYSKDNPAKAATTGDLLVDVDVTITETGYEKTTGTGVPTQLYPDIASQAFSSNRAVAGLKYSKDTGQFTAAITPVVAKISGAKGINVSESSTNPGDWTISYLSEGSVGLVDSIEPINARLEFRGLSSYIKLPPTYTTSYGIIGKIVLPKGYFSNKDLSLIFHLFGDSAVAANGAANVSFQFEYSAVSAANGVAPTKYTAVGIDSYPKPGPKTVTFSMAPVDSYAQYVSIKVAPADLYIPAEFISEDTIVNFKIVRVAPTADAYAGNVGLLSTYWYIPTTNA